MLAQIVDPSKKAQTSHAPIQNLTDKISNVFVPAVMIIAILTFMIWYSFVDATFVQALLFAVFSNCHCLSVRIRFSNSNSINGWYCKKC